jgi:DNA-binding response OmpR family regulator
MNAVLIADDDSRIRMLVRATLAGQPSTLLEADNGDEAWRLLEQHQPSVALLDVRMPRRSGLDLAREIRRNVHLRGTRIIILSGDASQLDVESGHAAGADLYLTKPFSPRALLAAVSPSDADAADASHDATGMVGALPAD